mmetsp:Transcript_16587/g.47237  ORF Transcript_16587/g.47237 Transcript_16587/m.47237 type:complete len:209 (-) Transcript_16587:426-1052(-)
MVPGDSIRPALVMSTAHIVVTTETSVRYACMYRARLSCFFALWSYATKNLQAQFSRSCSLVRNPSSRMSSPPMVVSAFVSFSRTMSALSTRMSKTRNRLISRLSGTTMARSCEGTFIRSLLVRAGWICLSFCHHSNAPLFSRVSVASFWSTTFASMFTQMPEFSSSRTCAPRSAFVQASSIAQRLFPPTTTCTAGTTCSSNSMIRLRR